MFLNVEAYSSPKINDCIVDQHLTSRDDLSDEDMLLP